jgi:hypothetical protein
MHGNCGKLKRIDFVYMILNTIPMALQDINKNLAAKVGVIDFGAAVYFGRWRCTNGCCGVQSTFVGAP